MYNNATSKVEPVSSRRYSWKVKDLEIKREHKFFIIPTIQ